MKQSFENELKQRCAPLDEILCDLKKSDAIMKEFETKREMLGTELWIEAGKLMVDGYKSQLLQAIVMIEEIKSFINADNSTSDVKTSMLEQLNEWLDSCRKEYEKNKKLRDAVKEFDKRKEIYERS